MKIRDKVGNELHPDQTLYWAKMDLYLKVADVVLPDLKEKKPGSVTVTLTFPLPADVRDDQDAFMSEFHRIHDPMEEARAKAAMEAAMLRAQREQKEKHHGIQPV